MLTLVLWQHVVFLCVSRTLFRMSLVMVVRHMLWSVRLASLTLKVQVLCDVTPCRLVNSYRRFEGT